MGCAQVVTRPEDGILRAFGRESAVEGVVAIAFEASKATPVFCWAVEVTGRCGLGSGYSICVLFCSSVCLWCFFFLRARCTVMILLLHSPNLALVVLVPKPD